MEPEITWEAVMAGCVGDTSSDWGVFMIDGHTIIAPNITAALLTTPPKQLSWEGHGGRPADCSAPSESDIAFAAMEAAVQRVVDAVKGETVAAAMTAMHAQRRSDGRPVPYLPEENL